ncbi:hypothetical protein HMPREF3039_00350 [Akkermansia sp. KLE1798]|nr:hypothetical protein HMPREF3039_00350 [Akkermansia sp. KLE1798]KZA03459.1 hypothetical protein HMPREF1326_02888 [Akkermansia sp. KLE1605]
MPPCRPGFTEPPETLFNWKNGEDKGSSLPFPGSSEKTPPGMPPENAFY